MVVGPFSYAFDTIVASQWVLGNISKTNLACIIDSKRVNSNTSQQLYFMGIVLHEPTLEFLWAENIHM